MTEEQPLKHKFDDVGSWKKGHDGRFSASVSFGQHALVHIPDTTWGINTVLHFLQPEYTARYTHTAQDVNKLVRLVTSFIENPKIPREEREAVRQQWEELKVRREAFDKPKPAPAAAATTTEAATPISAL